jgi:hypothetical protein
MKLSYVAGAAAIAGFLGFGGMSLAYAQDSSSSGNNPTVTTDYGSSSTPTQDNSQTPDYGGHRSVNCPNMGGSGDSNGGSGSSGSTEGSNV